MSTYLDLVNKVIDESGAELDQLTVGTWSSAEAGRRLYPRIKRLVAEAWKLMQMERNEWEFKTAELHAPVYARVKFQDGSRTVAGPSVGDTYEGQDSGFLFTVRQVILEDGDWTLGTAKGMIEFETYTGDTLVVGELFEEVTPTAGNGEFVYLEKGNYDFTDEDSLFREIHWDTMVAYSDDSTPTPVKYIPWDNWAYTEASFTAGTVTPPAYYSQDPFGKVVFYPQTLEPFNVNFVYQQGPQTLSAATDTPEGLASEYHEWIAWEALMNLALYDKNPDLYGYAKTMATKYKYRAERNVMPLMSWGANRFNQGPIYE